jgi:hypothetical protein
MLMRRLIFKWVSTGALLAIGMFSAPLASLAADPGPMASETADDESAPAAAPAAQFRSTMDKVFGAGRWRQTGGYRSAAREDELRRQGAGTVAPGHLSRHSLGSPAAPGAYDAVVPGLSSQSAAVRLRQSGGSFARVVAEGAHGRQGSHLHIEPLMGAGAPAPGAAQDDTIYLRIVAGRRNPALSPPSQRSTAKD